MIHKSIQKIHWGIFFCTINDYGIEKDDVISDRKHVFFWFIFQENIIFLTEQSIQFMWRLLLLLSFFIKLIK